jgi:hypothetical protein
MLLPPPVVRRVLHQTQGVPELPLGQPEPDAFRTVIPMARTTSRAASVPGVVPALSWRASLGAVVCFSDPEGEGVSWGGLGLAGLGDASVLV